MFRLGHLPRVVGVALVAAGFGSVRDLAAAPTPAGPAAFAIDLPAGRANLAEITSTLAAVSVARTWSIQEKTEGRIVIQLVHRKIDATVTYLFSDQKIVAYCESYQVDGSGRRGKPEQPTRWLKYLQEDIRRALGGTPGTPGPIAPVAQTNPAPPAPAAAVPTPASPAAVAAASPAAMPVANAPAKPAVSPAPNLPPGAATPPAAAPEGTQLVQFPGEAVSPLSYYSRVYLLRPAGAAGPSAPLRVFDETPGAQGGGPGRSIEIGTLDPDRVLGWNRPAGVMSLRADTGTPTTPRLALELAAGKACYIIVDSFGPSITFRALPEADGKALLMACKPAAVGADAPDSLDAYLVAAASDGRADAVKKFLSADSTRNYTTALTAAIDQAQPQVINTLVQAGATVPTDNTPDARFRLGAFLKALADLRAGEGKATEAKGYYEQAIALFNTVKPELVAAAEAKFQKVREKASGDSSFWSKLAETAGKAITVAAAAQGAGSGGGLPATGAAGGSPAALAQLLTLKNSSSFDQFFQQMKSAGASPQAGASAAGKEIPKELLALLDSVTNKAAMDKTMSERCDLLVAEIQKKLLAQAK